MKKFGISLSIILNVITLGLIIWGFLFGGVFYLINNSFIKPIYVRDTSQFKLLEVQKGGTVFLGDSLVEGGEWNELFPQSNIRNRGVVGDDTVGIIARLDEITKSQPAQVFLMVGINDLAIRTPKEKIIANIVDIVEKIHTDSPETEIFVQSVLPNRKQLHRQIESLNIELEKEIAGKATWVNLYPLFLDEEKVSMNNSLSNDDAHLLGQGYMIWRDAISDFVNKSE